MHITLHFTHDDDTKTASTFAVAGLSYGPHSRQPGRSWVQQTGEDGPWYDGADESPSEIAALIQAARDEEWRRQIVTSLIGFMEHRNHGGGGEYSLAYEAFAYADAIIAADKERRHADKG